MEPIQAQGFVHPNYEYAEKLLKEGNLINALNLLSTMEQSCIMSLYLKGKVSATYLPIVAQNVFFTFFSR